MVSKFRYPNHGYIHTLFFKVMRKHVPGFRKLPMAEQYQLCDMVNKSQHPRYKHKRHEGATAFWYKEITSRFGRGRFDKINSTAKIFDVSLNWSKEKGETRAYKPSRNTENALSWYHKLVLRAERQEQGQLVAHTGRTLRTPPAPIASKAINGHTAKNCTDAPIQSFTPINTPNLRRYIKALETIIKQHEDPDYTQGELFADQPGMTLTDRDIGKIRYRTRFAVRVIGDSYIDLHQDTVLLHQYVEHSTGRLYARGSINLQTVPREIRQTALTGFYDYDMENCHYALFDQLAAKAEYQTTAITNYLVNKKAIRAELANATARPLKAIKQCLIAIMYGTRKTAFASEYHTAALPDYLGEDAAHKFIHHPFVEALFEDVRAGSKAIIEHQAKTNRHNFTNAMGYTISSNEDPKKIIAHLLQGLEAKILEIARIDQGMNIILLQHDGFTCHQKINRKRLSGLVRDQIGYEIAFSEELLQVPENLFPSGEVIPNRETIDYVVKSITYDDFSSFPVS